MSAQAIAVIHSNLQRGPGGKLGAKYKCVSHKRLIIKACIQVLEDKQANVREKMKAAGILERMGRERDLASRRKKQKSAQMLAHGKKTKDLSDILERINSNGTNDNDLRQASTGAEDKANISSTIAGSCGVNADSPC